ncbi:Csu type fimbrial protein [Pseudomonas panipatensis]|uniref:Csu type fimbrial protein n=1 Tax=Pseudomonas panipatensis TaxID=428992 RepID=UPI0035AED441
MKAHALALLFSISGLALSTASTQAANVLSGQIQVRLQIERGCQINNGSSGINNVDFGSIDFGSQTALFATVEAQLSGNGGNGISIQCSPGDDAKLTIVKGQNDIQGGDTASHALANGSKYVPYELYSDSGRTNKLANGISLSFAADGSARPFNLYARAFGKAALVPGTYSDILSVQVEF